MGNEAKERLISRGKKVIDLSVWVNKWSILPLVLIVFVVLGTRKEVFIYSLIVGIIMAVILYCSYRRKDENLAGLQMIIPLLGWWIIEDSNMEIWLRINEMGKFMILILLVWFTFIGVFPKKFRSAIDCAEKSKRKT